VPDHKKKCLSLCMHWQVRLLSKGQMPETGGNMKTNLIECPECKTKRLKMVTVCPECGNSPKTTKKKTKNKTNGTINTTLIQCAACKKMISKTAKACPQCGEPSKSNKILKMGIGLIMMGFGLMILIPILGIVIMAVIGVAL